MLCVTHDLHCSYYSTSTGATLPDFYNVPLLDTFIVKATEYVDIQKKYLPTTHIWLGETSSMYHGGAALYAESYVDGFMYASAMHVQTSPYMIINIFFFHISLFKVVG